MRYKLPTASFEALILHRTMKLCSTDKEKPSVISIPRIFQYMKKKATGAVIACANGPQCNVSTQYDYCTDFPAASFSLFLRPFFPIKSICRGFLPPFYVQQTDFSAVSCDHCGENF